MDTRRLIDVASSTINSDATHNLEPAFRCRLLASFSGLSGVSSTESAVDRWVELARVTVERVLPIWEALFPNDLTPRRALEVASMVSSGQTSAKSAQSEIDRLWTHCDSLLWKNEKDAHVVMVGYGAVQVIRQALSTTPIGCPDVVDESIPDIDIDPFDHDSFFFAAVAYSHGAPWEHGSNVEKR